MQTKIKYIFITFLLAGFTYSIQAQKGSSKDEQEIRNLMKFQQEAWSNHDIEGFMSGYWKSTELRFYGASGVKEGWQATLDGYKKRYPTKEHTGTLNFTLESISQVKKGVYYVMGKYHLTRTIGDAEGVFLIILKKIKGEWKIVADLSC